EKPRETTCQITVAKTVPHSASFRRTFSFGANTYKIYNPTKNVREVITHRIMFQELINSDNPIKLNTYSPITLPNTEITNANAITTTIISISPRDINLFTINDRSSSTSYALLNDFVIALTPFDADHNVPSIPTDKRPPLLLPTMSDKFDSIILTISSGKNEDKNCITDSPFTGKKPINVTMNNKKGNKESKKK